jgi:hypothetical protein
MFVHEIRVPASGKIFRQNRFDAQVRAGSSYYQYFYLDQRIIHWRDPEVEFFPYKKWTFGTVT